MYVILILLAVIKLISYLDFFYAKDIILYLLQKTHN